MLTVCVLAACGGDDGDGGTPFCGDAVCNGAETTATCASDCPATPRCGDGVCSGGETNATCPGDCPTGPRCGDGVCNGNETTGSCPGDCPPQACTPDPATCSGETICLNGTCVAAFGRAYRIVARSATIPQFDPAGDPWDVPGGLPDPYAVITLNGVALGMTATVQDTLTPAWNQGTNPTNVPAGSTIRVDVFDEDIAEDDGIVACVLMPVTADQLHAGMVTCSGQLGSVTVGFLTQ